MSFLSASLMAISLLVQDPAAQPSQESSPTQLEDVVVQRQRLERTVRNFVDDVTAPSMGRGPARWDRQVCVGIANVRNPAAQYIVDRVSQVAMEVGLEPGEPGCRANVLIIGASDGQALAQGLIEASPRAFRPNWGGADRGAQALERFRQTDAPVRWWHVALPVDSQTGAPAVRIPGESAGMISVFAAARLRTQVQNNLEKAIVIVDFSRAEGLNVQQLADYIAMVALAQVDPEATTGSFDTVLNLFTPGVEVAGLTDWDRSYLTALYGAELNQTRPSHQSGSVANVMVHDRRAANAVAAGAGDGEPNEGE